MVNEQLIEHLNKLERWLKYTKGQYQKYPMRIAGYFVLIGVMIISNFIAVLRWPFASIFKWISTNKETAETSRDIRDPVEAGPEYLLKMIEQHEYVLIDFWAAWCGPCIMMNRSLERLAADREFTCLIAKVDTVAYPKLAENTILRDCLHSYYTTMEMK